jgi:hypothetical protein
MFVTRKELQNYLSCSNKTAIKKYKWYLEKSEKDHDQELTIYDLSRIDDLPIQVVKQKIKM